METRTFDVPSIGPSITGKAWINRERGSVYVELYRPDGERVRNENLSLEGAAKRYPGLAAELAP